VISGAFNNKSVHFVGVIIVLVYDIRCVIYNNKGCFNTVKELLLRKINCQLLQQHVPTLISNL
jgi:hypothetical protein